MTGQSCGQNFPNEGGKALTTQEKPAAKGGPESGQIGFVRYSMQHIDDGDCGIYLKTDIASFAFMAAILFYAGWRLGRMWPLNQQGE